MGYATEHRGRRPTIVLPGTGQLLTQHVLEVRTNQNSEGI